MALDLPAVESTSRRGRGAKVPIPRVEALIGSSVSQLLLLEPVAAVSATTCWMKSVTIRYAGPRYR
jgi:hypothetical protein